MKGEIAGGGVEVEEIKSNFEKKKSRDNLGP